MRRKAFHLLMLACLLIGTAAIPTQAAPEAQLEARTTHYVMYSPQEFRPITAGCTYATEDYGIYPTVDGGCDFTLQVFLPEPARITGVTFYYQDNDPIANGYFFLYRDNPVDSHPQDQLSYLGTGATPPSQETHEVSDYFVDVIPSPWIEVTNSLWAYQLVAMVRSKGSEHLILKGARVKYDMPIVPSPSVADEYVTLAGYNFHPNRSDAPFIIYDNRISLNPPREGDFIYSLFDLPAGAAIEEMEFYYLDNDAEMPTFALVGWSPENGFQSYLANVSFPDEPPSPNVIPNVYTLSPPVTVPGNQRFGLLFFPGSANHALRGVRIRYKPGTAPTTAEQSETLAGLDFYPSNNTALTFTSNQAALVPTSGALSHAYYANLHPPANTHIGRATYIFKDTNSGDDLIFEATSYNIMEGDTTDTKTPEHRSGAVTATGNPQWLAFSGIPLGMTDPQNRAYRLVVRVEDGYENLELVGARVEYYTPRPVYLPLLAK